jgi:hypothetical protein
MRSDLSKGVKPVVSTASYSLGIKIQEYQHMLRYCSCTVFVTLSLALDLQVRRWLEEQSLADLATTTSAGLSLDEGQEQPAEGEQGDPCSKRACMEPASTRGAHSTPAGSGGMPVRPSSKHPPTGPPAKGNTK